VATVDIEEFYDENEARRSSAEFEFGDSWTDRDGNLYELSWVEATGELYLMLGPEARVVNEPFLGDTLEYDEPVTGLQVRVIATIPTIAAVEEALNGWDSAMGEPGSVTWLAERFGTAAN
jgi:hypothetical protein